MWSKYGKAIAAVIVAALTVASSALSDGTVDAGEWVQVAIGGTTAVSVWLVPLVPGWRGAKTGVAVVLAVLNALTAYVIGGIDAGELINLALAALGVIAVSAAPAESVGDELVRAGAQAVPRRT